MQCPWYEDKDLAQGKMKKSTWEALIVNISFKLLQIFYNDYSDQNVTIKEDCL